MASHGDITEVTFNHPTIGQGVFFPKANEGNTFDQGGIRTSDDASIISGSDYLLSLSPMPLSHQVVRLVLLEQLYRGCSILNNTDYHK